MITKNEIQTLDELLRTPVTVQDVVRDRIHCADGVTLSVQASRYHYCNPRDNNGPWTRVEVGYPSVSPPESWSEYAEEWEDPTGTIYGYIPVELVREFIEIHGGEKGVPDER